DFSFTHGDGWTAGGPPLRVENKQQWLAAVGKAPYEYRNLDSVKVESHGDIAITYGMYRARNKSDSADRGAFTVWFERVYAYRDGRWQYLSHRTVHGPTYGETGNPAQSSSPHPIVAGKAYQFEKVADGVYYATATGSMVAGSNNVVIIGGGE